MPEFATEFNDTPAGILDELRKQSLATYRLALGLSLAARVEPALIRRMRLETAPRCFGVRFPVACEQALWFGPWVASRDHRGFRFSPEFSLLLRERLLDSGEYPGGARAAQVFLTETRQLIESQHTRLHAAIQLEETLVYLELAHRGDPHGLNAALQRSIAPALMALIDADRTGLARWLSEMTRRFSEPLRKQEAIAALQSASESRHQWELQRTSGLPGLNSDLAHTDRLILRIRRSGMLIQIGFLVAECDAGIEVPDVRPLTLRVRRDQSELSRRVPMPPQFLDSYRPDPSLPMVSLEGTDSEALIDIPECGFAEVISRSSRITIITADGRYYRVDSDGQVSRSSRSATIPQIGELEVDYSGQKLRRLPEALFSKIHLQRLLLAGNQLESLDPRLSDLPQLMELDASNNQLRELPDWLGKLPRLEVLRANSNRLKSVSPGVAQSRRLRTLELQNNLLESLPSELGGLPELTILRITGNKLKNLPSTVAPTDASVLRWLRDKNDPPRKNRRAKLYLLGQRSNVVERILRDWNAERDDQGHSSSEPVRLLRVPATPASAASQSSESQTEHVELTPWDLTGDAFDAVWNGPLLTGNALVLLFENDSARASTTLKTIQRLLVEPVVILVVESASALPKTDMKTLQKKYG
ncbi:MAG: leucine-rich repeat domain-containing protein, partial [Planctomycetota bacterium]|nr:leucine-rich repeat domain-containing protein [Planctomycetota bacterium]